MSRAVSACLGLLLASAPGLARGASREPASLNAVSFHPLALLGPGVALQYERFLPPGYSFVSGAGFRWSTRGDYDVWTFAPALELRRWVLRRAPFTTLDRSDEMAGLFLSLREDVGFTSVEDTTRGRLAGRTIELDETLALGYRFRISRAELSVLPGFTVRTLLDPEGWLAPFTTFAPKLDLTVGVTF